MSEIGRNDPCPCGSGKKYKKCGCGFSTGALFQAQPPFQIRVVEPHEIPDDVLRTLHQHQQQAARIGRYGHVRPPIAVDYQGYKVVAIGGKLAWGKWKIFHDFLFEYLADVLGKEWGAEEIVKPFGERRPILQWYHQLCEFQRAHHAPNGQGISAAIASGPVMAYLWLAYDPYTLEHHALLRTTLVRRLKIQDQFQGARYEVSVAASFVRAGFELAREDESDIETSHCEFNATHIAIGATYSVEAKSRHRDGYLGRPGIPRPPADINADISTLVTRALGKRAEHQRIVFIDVNVPPDRQQSEVMEHLDQQVTTLEETQEGSPYPSAFLFFTNQPYHYVGNDEPEPGRRTLFTGINIPALGTGPSGVSAEAGRRYLTQEHPAILALFESLTKHGEIPSAPD
jgi:hypothetical protein